MSYFLVFTVSAASIGIPLAASLKNFRRIGKRYLPLIIYLVVGATNEIISFYMIRHFKSNMVNSNVYSLAEYGILLWLFFSIKPQKLSWRLSFYLVGIMVWLLDNFYLHHITDDNGYFRIFASLTISWLCIDHLNYILFSDKIEPFRNTDLLLGIGLFAYFAYSAFLHSFSVVSIGLPDSFYAQLWLILSVINIIANLIFMSAILCIPKHQPLIFR